MHQCLFVITSSTLDILTSISNKIGVFHRSFKPFPSNDVRGEFQPWLGCKRTEITKNWWNQRDWNSGRTPLSHGGTGARERGPLWFSRNNKLIFVPLTVLLFLLLSVSQLARNVHLRTGELRATARDRPLPLPFRFTCLGSRPLSFRPASLGSWLATIHIAVSKSAQFSANLSAKLVKHIPLCPNNHAFSFWNYFQLSLKNALPPGLQDLLVTLAFRSPKYKKKNPLQYCIHQPSTFKYQVMPVNKMEDYRGRRPVMSHSIMCLRHNYGLFFFFF